MTPTPRTDEAVREALDPSGDDTDPRGALVDAVSWVAAESRNLERELAELKGGERVVVPKSVDHARMMLGLAHRYLQTSIAGDAVKGVAFPPTAQMPSEGK